MPQRGGLSHGASSKRLSKGYIEVFDGDWGMRPGGKHAGHLLRFERFRAHAEDAAFFHLDVERVTGVEMQPLPDVSGKVNISFRRNRRCGHKCNSSLGHAEFYFVRAILSRQIMGAQRLENRIGQRGRRDLHAHAGKKVFSLDLSHPHGERSCSSHVPNPTPEPDTVIASEARQSLARDGPRSG